LSRLIIGAAWTTWAKPDAGGAPTVTVGESPTTSSGWASSRRCSFDDERVVLRVGDLGGVLLVVAARVVGDLVAKLVGSRDRIDDGAGWRGDCLDAACAGICGAHRLWGGSPR